jgi:ribosomal-protein-alanine N-acetyltransferase
MRASEKDVNTRIRPGRHTMKNSKMPAPFKIRRFRLSDLDRVEWIENASFGKDAWDRNLFAEFFYKCGGLFLVSLHRSVVCGYMITCIRGERAEIVSIAVAPQDRGRGVAPALMESTFRRLRRRKTARIVLMVKTTNARARAFYLKYGFDKVRLVRQYYEDGTDGLLMARRV